MLHFLSTENKGEKKKDSSSPLEEMTQSKQELLPDSEKTAFPRTTEEPTLCWDEPRFVFLAHNLLELNLFHYKANRSFLDPVRIFIFTLVTLRTKDWKTARQKELFFCF